MNASSTIPSENVAQDSSALTDSRLAARSAEIALQAFFDYQTRFNAITRRARERFLARDWAGSFDDAAERLHFYNDVLEDLTNRIRKLMGARLPERSIWTGIKAVYSSLIARSPAWEIAETFFNSLTRRVFRRHVDNRLRYRFRRARRRPLDIRLISDQTCQLLVSSVDGASTCGGLGRRTWAGAGKRRWRQNSTFAGFVGVLANRRCSWRHYGKKLLQMAFFFFVRKSARTHPG